MRFGIDFGTTNSAIVFDHVNLVAIVPTAIAFNPINQQFRFGQEVREHHEELLASGWNVMTSIKTCLDDPDKTWLCGGDVETPETLTTRFFEYLIDLVAEMRPDDPLERAVISIPVGFTAQKRKALRRAAMSAPLEVTDFVSESTAAVLDAKRELKGLQRVVVFDWGGGTLDVSVLSLSGNRVKELAIGALPRAGDVIDGLVAEWVYAQHRVKYPDVPEDLRDVPAQERDQLLVACELAKRQLSDDVATSVALPKFLGSVLRVPLDRDRLRSLIKLLMNEAFDTLDRAIAQAGLSARNIDAVLPIGGTSSLAALQEEIADRYGYDKVFSLEDPRWVVARGASYLAERLAANPEGRVAKVDQWLGLRLADDSVLRLVQPGDAFGAPATTHHLGIVEDTDAAQLVFVEPAARGTAGDELPCNIGYLPVPMQGFNRERLTLKTELTPDLIFVAQAKSEAGNEQDTKEFIYEKLRFIYDLS